MIVIDARDYTSDLSFQGFAVMVAAAMLSIILSIYLIVGNPSFLTRAEPVSYVWAIGSAIVVATLILVLKGKGMLFRLPLRCMEDSILIQPVMGIRPRKLAYKDLASFEVWHNLGYRKVRSGASALTFRHGAVTSVEPFPDKDSVRRFAEGLKPVLEKNGMSMKTFEEADSLHFMFQRDVRKRI
ncbi:MAG: hypothetical protein AB1324_07500 [Candidatus Micrarchaeota archaeon]